jgi:hypothetical protein
MIHAHVVCHRISFFLAYLFHFFLRIFIDFNISAIVKKRDGSNCPFTVVSSAEFDELKNLVAEKLRCFPGLLDLRYRLDTDKPKAAATSIQTVEEYEIFKDRMRSLIVPQKLPSGKLSTRILKPVTVCFEDGGADSDFPTQSQSHNSFRSSEKKVCFSLLRSPGHY